LAGIFFTVFLLRKRYPRLKVVPCPINILKTLVKLF